MYKYDIYIKLEENYLFFLFLSQLFKNFEIIFKYTYKISKFKAFKFNFLKKLLPYR